MKRILFLTSLVLLLGAFPVSAAEKSYVNGIDANYPPFAYIDEKSGQPAGFDVDSLNWIAKKMGFTVTHKPIAWDGIITALQVKQIDMVGSGMSITEKRRKMVDFSNPYWTVSRVFLVKKDSALTPADILGKKIKLGVQRGTSEADAIQQEQKAKNYPFELRFYESAPLAVEDLLNGRIDAALMDSLPAEDHRQGQGRQEGRHARPTGRVRRGVAQGRQGTAPSFGRRLQAAYGRSVLEGTSEEIFEQVVFSLSFLSGKT